MIAFWLTAALCNEPTVRFAPTPRTTTIDTDFRVGALALFAAAVVIGVVFA